MLPLESWEEVEAIVAELRDPDGRSKSYPCYAAIPIVGLAPGHVRRVVRTARADVEYFDNPKPGEPRGRIHVCRRFTYGELKPGTNTEPERYVSFGQKVYEALSAMPKGIETPILFPAPRGGYIDIEKFRHREWAPAFKAAGISHRRLDDMRHTYASWMLAQDVPPAKLAKMMGTSITQIEDTYHRFLQSDDRYGTSEDTFGAAVAR